MADILLFFTTKPQIIEKINGYPWHNALRIAACIFILLGISDEPRGAKLL